MWLITALLMKDVSALKASRKLQPELPNHRLDTVAETCNFNLTNHHNAIADAEACAAIALKLL